MTLKFYKDFNIQPKADSGGGGGTSGIPEDAIALYYSSTNEFLCLWSDVTNITQESESSWSGRYNNQYLNIWIEVDSESGEEFVKMQYNSNDVIMRLDCEKIYEILPTE